MAKYIAESFLNGKKFRRRLWNLDIPLANLYMVNVTNPESKTQIMTVHQKHL